MIFKTENNWVVKISDCFVNWYVVNDANLTEGWYKNASLHRGRGPAIILYDGMMVWCMNGKTHREGGPAVIRANGEKIWFRDGAKIEQGNK